MKATTLPEWHRKCTEELIFQVSRLYGAGNVILLDYGGVTVRDEGFKYLHVGTNIT